ncbi:MAG: hypothetical protein QW096_13510 [Thermofilaceae archaeon]
MRNARVELRGPRGELSADQDIVLRVYVETLNTLPLNSSSAVRRRIHSSVLKIKMYTTGE